MFAAEIRRKGVERIGGFNHQAQTNQPRASRSEATSSRRCILSLALSGRRLLTASGG